MQPPFKLRHSKFCFGQNIYSQRIFKRLAKILIRLRVCAGWYEHLQVAHITLLEISCRGSIISDTRKCVQVPHLSNKCTTKSCDYVIRSIGSFKVGKSIRNRYNKVPNRTRNTVWESDKYTRKHHIQESQEVGPFLAGDHKAA